jgi:kynurenine formamidase
LFDIDFARYRLVDLSLAVIPNGGVPGRPFEVKEGRLEDGTRKFDIVNTHSHVGTHIESPWHFYGEGATCTDYPLEKFMGKAALFRGQSADGQNSVQPEQLRAALHPKHGDFSILFLRNEIGGQLLNFDPACVDYLASLRLDVLAFDSTISFGNRAEDGQRFHDLMLGGDTLLAEFPDNAREIDKEDFYLFAVPIRYQGLDSCPCRMFAVVER